MNKLTLSYVTLLAYKFFFMRLQYLHAFNSLIKARTK